MCGRFAITLPSDAMAQLFAAAPANDLPNVPNFNVCPTTQVHVVTGGEAERRLVSMRWGFLPAWYQSPTDGPLLINARAETIAQKPAFREACRSRRCLIPVDGFYEWSKDEDGKRLPWFIQATESRVLALAGVWQSWHHQDRVIDTCAIVTTAANQAIKAIHHRMPVVIEPVNLGKWLGEEGKGAALLMQSVADDALRFHRVDMAVNSNRATGSALTTPLDC